MICWRVGPWNIRTSGVPRGLVNLYCSASRISPWRMESWAAMITVTPFGPSRLTDYLANERTFLAYVRTSLSVRAFGFVISRFGLFLRMLPGSSNVKLPPTNTSDWLGLAFGVFGCLLAVLGVWRFLATTRDLARDQFRPNESMNAIVGWATVLLGIALVTSSLRLL